jgi:uncharacterized tellurite resistance protein B-like protein
MGFFNFKSQSQKERESAVKNLIAVMLADGKIEDNEKVHLGRICQRYGITDKQFKEILQKPQDIKFTVPQDPNARMQQLIDIVWMMMIDGHIDQREMDMCIALAVNMGFRPSAVPQLVQHIINEIKKQAQAQKVDVDVNEWLDG